MGQTKLNIGQSLELNMLTDRAFGYKVYSSWQRGYNTLNSITEMFMNRSGGPKQTPQVKVEVATLGGNDVYSTITATPTISGANLVITVPAGHNFRAGDDVQDNNWKKGHVVSTTDTTITLSPLGYNSTAWNTAVDYQSGTTVVKYGVSSIGKGSQSPTSLYNVPKGDFTYTQVQREAASLYRRDNVGTYVGSQKSYDVLGESGMWTNTQFREAVVRMKKFEELTMFWGSRDIRNAGTSQETTYTMGIRDQIINRARSGNNPGLHYSLSSELTQSDFHDILDEYLRRVGPGAKPVAIMGNKAFGSFQSNITNPYILQAGDRNTFGGSGVSGINVQKYAYNNLNIDFTYGDFLSAPGFYEQTSNITGYGRAASTILLMDLAPVAEASGNGVMNAIERYYFGPNMYISGIRKGMYDFSETMSRGDIDTSGFMGGDTYISDVDQVSLDCYTDQGYYIYPEKMCLIELAS